MANISTLLNSLENIAPDSISTDKTPIDEVHTILKEMNTPRNETEDQPNQSMEIAVHQRSK